MKKRILAIFLVFLSSFAFSVSAQDEEIFQVPNALKGNNLALTATASASSVDSPNYTIECINNGVANTSFDNSWCNASSNSPMGSDCWVQLTWDKPITFNLVSLYSVSNYEIGEYTIKYDKGGSWKDLLKVTNNDKSRRDHPFTEKVTTDKIRIQCLKGVYNSVDQMHFARITELEVYNAVATSPTSILEYASSNLDLGNLADVTERITLPSSTLEETVGIKWKSKTPNIVDNKGYVVRPDFGSGDAVGILEAEFQSAGLTLKKEYNVTVKQLKEDDKLIDDVISELKIENPDKIVTNLILPQKDKNGYTNITWKSHNEDYITSEGVVKRDEKEAINVKLTATIGKRETSKTKEFNLTILPSLTPIETQTIEMWRAAEITFESSKNYDVPYKDVDIDVVFTGPNNERMIMPGFWYENNVWKVRFAPTSLGEWSYSVICTDTENTGLHGRNGKINSVVYEGEHDIYKHGFIQSQEGKRYLTYADGTPFYYISDCGWFALSFKTPLYDTNAPYLGSSAFKSWMDIRKKQGYNGFRTNFFIGLGTDVDGGGNRNEGGFPWTKGLLKTKESSGTGNDGGDDAKHLRVVSTFDGNDKTVWKAGDNKYPQWLRVDYEEMKIVKSAKIVFAREDNWKFRLEASNDGAEYTTIIDKTEGFIGNEFSCELPKSVNARFYRLYIDGCESGKEGMVGEIYLYDQNNIALNHSYYFNDMNPEFFKNTDQRIQYIVNSGMIADLGLDWGRAIQVGSTEDYKRFSRYMVARYGAYPTIWHTAGEAATGPILPWIEVAQYTNEIDPYNRVNTLHNRVDNPDYGKFVEDLSWFDMTYSQSGHDRTEIIDIDYWENLYNRTPVKPFIEGELIFENINGHPTKNTVEGFWKVAMAGSMGFGYSAEGLWQSTIDYDQWHQVWGSAPIPWYVAVNKEGGARLPLMKKFMESLCWWELAPNKNAIIWNNPPKGIPSPYQKSNNDSSVVVAYMPSCNSRYNGTVNVRPNGEYTAKWYDTRTGEFILIDDQIKVNQSGTYTMPSQPDNTKDWAFVISLNTFNTEIYNNITFDMMSKEQAYDVTKDLQLIQNENIEWQSSNTKVLSNAGKIMRGEKDENVKLVAKIKGDNGSDEKHFNLIIKGDTTGGTANEK